MSVGSEHRLEVNGKIEPERCRGAGRLPRQRFCYELGAVVGRHPVLEEPSVEVDDPVVGDVALLERALANAIMATARWGQHLDGEQELPYRKAFAHHSTHFVHRRDIDVGLRDGFNLQLGYSILRLSTLDVSSPTRMSSAARAPTVRYPRGPFDVSASCLT